MSYSDSFPAQRPIFSLDAANAGRLDPRMTFTRASNANVWDGSKHLSSENLFLQSSDFDTSWTVEFLGLTGSQTDPAGGTNGWTIEEAATTSYHRLIQSISSGSSDYGLVFYAKQNTGTRYLTLALVTGNNNYEAATFDLAGGSPVMSSGSSSSFSSVSATQTASSNGYYKCVLKATGSPVDARISLVNSSSPTLTSYGSYAYAGDGSSSIDIAFASLSTTGATDYNATTTSIHRQYAPSLVSKSNNIGRFDHSTDGQSMGILIESQSTNLLTNSADFGGSWLIDNLTRELAAVGPDGTLSAFAFREETNSNQKRLLRGYTAGGGNVTISVYAKLLGNTRRLVIREVGVTGQSAVFDLATSTKVSGNGSIETVGNGWHRCQLNFSSTSTGHVAGIYLIPADSDGVGYDTSAYAGDGYSGLLLAMPQAEDQSFASSYIDTGTSGSTATRAAESLSVATADIGYTGGPFTIVSETEGGKGSYPRAWTISDSSLNNRLVVYRNSDTSTDNTDWYCYAVSDGSAQVSSTITSSASAGKLAVSYDTNDVSTCASGGTVTTDNAAVISGKLTTLHIGAQTNGVSNKLNGHVKRLSLYNEALSDTNLQALTS